MNRDDELTLRHWLRARDPGPARAALRERARAVPAAVRPARFPGLDLTLRAGFGLAPIARPLVLVGLALLVGATLVGLAVVQPWRPFPPLGLIAYHAPSATIGATGITLASADGTIHRQISTSTPNVYDHSPRWSRDGRTVLFARTSQLDALSSCGGVGSVVLYDMATSTERVVATGLRPMNVIEWSPSGNLAAYTYPPPGCGAQVELGVVDLRSGAVTTKIVLPQESEQAPGQGVAWHVEWAGETPTAVPDSIVSANGPDYTTSIDVRSNEGRSVVHYAWTTPTRMPKLSLTDGLTDAPIDLGPGGVPAWSPDDAEIAYVQPGGPAGPDMVAFVRDHLVIATAATGARRVLADVLMPDGIGADVLPTVAWTSDGGAIYWIDIKGAHVVDVVTGRLADIVGIPEACDELRWQPVP